MTYQYPHAIVNDTGEKLIFLSVQKEADGDRLLVENFVQPKQGPPMHTHFKQDECLTVLEGKIGYQILGEEPQYATEGATIEFKRGTPHRFWNAGDTVLHCNGWIKPANTIEFYLTAIYDAQKKSGKKQPAAFDSAYLLTKYKNEYELNELPMFVKKVVMPITYQIGRLLGKYKKFADAPTPL